MDKSKWYQPQGRAVFGQGGWTPIIQQRRSRKIHPVDILFAVFGLVVFLTVLVNIFIKLAGG